MRLPLCSPQNRVLQERKVNAEERLRSMQEDNSRLRAERDGLRRRLAELQATLSEKDGEVSAGRGQITNLGGCLDPTGRWFPSNGKARGVRSGTSGRVRDRWRQSHCHVISGWGRGGGENGMPPPVTHTCVAGVCASAARPGAQFVLPVTHAEPHAAAEDTGPWG